jgi:methanogenic corrinoid protein MtbC1
LKILSTIDNLITAVMEGKNSEAVTIAEALLASGIPVRAIIQEGLTVALKSLDRKCTSEEFNLLELIMAGRAMVDVMDKVVRRYLQSYEAVQTGPTVVLGTIEGDIHDLGKYVVALVLKAAGFRVIDLGKDIEPNFFVKIAKEEAADYILVSSLITTSIPHVRKIREVVMQEGLTVKIVAGGAALQQVSAEKLAVDYVAMDVFDGLHYLNGEVGV